MKVLSCRRQTGTFTNDKGQIIEYDNLTFTVDTGDIEGMLFGTKYSDIKVSVKDFNKVYSGDPNSLHGKDIIFAFDQNKHLIGIYNVK